jgi:hypothetical protein
MNLEIAHETLVRNDEQIRDMEYKHLTTRHQQSIDLLRRQHEVELANQREYMKHAEQEMKQRHLGESRQLPKNLKVMCCSSAHRTVRILKKCIAVLGITGVQKPEKINFYVSLLEIACCRMTAIGRFSFVF